MSLSIQTNISSLIAENNIRTNSAFQENTIAQLSSGYRINSSADDAAGLAVANKYRSDTAELTQGVLNANNGVSSLQIVDGGLNNISTIVDRLRTLATESASNTFTGSRTTLNNEYQGLLLEINRQASNVNLNTGGSYNTNLVTFVGGGNSQNGSSASQANGQVTVNLSGANSAVDALGLGIASSNIAGGGTELSTSGTGTTNNTIRLDDTATTFLTSATQNFSFHIATATGNTDVTVPVTGGTEGLTGAAVISSLNTSLSQYGITASIANDGTLQFGGSTAFTATTTGVANGVAEAAGVVGNVVNTSNYSLDSSTGAGGAFAAFTAGGGTSASETVIFQNGAGSTTVTLDETNAGTIDQALTTLNTALNATGISAVKTADGNNISFQSTTSFNANETAFTAGAGGGTGNLFGGTGALAVAGPSSTAGNTGNALQALTALANAVTNLGLVQGTVGAGINKLNYAVNLAQSQITNYSAAQSSIRDADVAAQAANLTKAQVLQQASLAALAQANSAPQAVLSLLKG
ncbi:MAG TPA: flagellin [Bryobacteraceae bacterium]|jgi:flagellin|nr:flagellin [Bryobacteraceae bacterium]